MAKEPSGKTRIETGLYGGLNQYIDEYQVGGDAQLTANNVSCGRVGELVKRPETFEADMVTADGVSIVDGDTVYGVDSTGFYKEPFAVGQTAEHFPYNVLQDNFVKDKDYVFVESEHWNFGSGEHPNFSYAVSGTLLQIRETATSVVHTHRLAAPLITSTVYNNKVYILLGDLSLVNYDLGAVGTPADLYFLRTNEMYNGPAPTYFGMDAATLERPQRHLITTRGTIRAHTNRVDDQNIDVPIFGFNTKSPYDNTDPLYVYQVDGEPTDQFRDSTGAIFTPPLTTGGTPELATRILDYDGTRVLFMTRPHISADTANISSDAASRALERERYGIIWEFDAADTYPLYESNSKVRWHNIVSGKTFEQSFRHTPPEQVLKKDCAFPVNGVLMGEGYAVTYLGCRSKGNSIGVSQFGASRWGYMYETQFIKLDSFGPGATDIGATALQNIPAHVISTRSNLSSVGLSPIDTASFPSLRTLGAQQAIVTGDPTVEFFGNLGKSLAGLVGITFDPEAEFGDSDVGPSLSRPSSIIVTNFTGGNVTVLGVLGVGSDMMVSQLGGFATMLNMPDLGQGTFGAYQTIILAKQIVPDTVSIGYMVSPIQTTYTHYKHHGANSDNSSTATVQRGMLAGSCKPTRIYFQDTDIQLLPFRGGVATFGHNTPLHFDGTAIRPLTLPRPLVSVAPSTSPYLRLWGVVAAPYRIVLSYEAKDGTIVRGEPSALSHVWFFEGDEVAEAGNEFFFPKSATMFRNLSAALPINYLDTVKAIRAELYMGADSGSPLKYLQAVDITDLGLGDLITFDISQVTLAALRSRVSHSLSAIRQSAAPVGNLVDPLRVGNRTWAIRSEKRRSLLYTSLDRESVETFTDENQLDLSNYNQEIVGLGSVDDKLIVFFRTTIIAVIDSGNGFQIIELSTDDGCVTKNSIAILPQGCAYANLRGINILDRSLAINYMSGPVERFLILPQFIFGTAVNAQRKEVHFLFPASFGAPAPNELPNPLLPLHPITTLVYNYEKDVWTTWKLEKTMKSLSSSGKNIISVDLDNNVTLWSSDNSTGADGALTSVSTGWIVPNGVQGFAKSSRISVLGKWFQDSPSAVNASEGSLKVTLFYDYEQEGRQDTYVVTRTHLAKESRHPERFQFYITPGKHQFSSLRMQFDEVNPNTSDVGKGFTIINIDMEVEADSRHSRSTGVEVSNGS